MTTPKFKKFNIEAYKPGKSKIKKLKKIIKLSANESALGMSPKATKILSNKKFNLKRYPDGKSQNLRAEISKKFDIKNDSLIKTVQKFKGLKYRQQIILKKKK